MNTDRIERETLIDAPLERVWDLVTEVGFWASESPTGIPDPVVEEGTTVVIKNAEYGEFPVRVVKVERPSYVAYRWASDFPGQELRDDNSTLVEFTLTEDDGQTRLRVVESGFAALTVSDAQRGKAVEANTSGWTQVLDSLIKRAA